MTKRVFWAAAARVALGAAAGCVGPQGSAATASGKAEIAAALAPSLVRVEYTVQFDKGEPPRAAGWAQRCPSCGRYHGIPVESLVSQERPLELPGLVISPTLVLCPDVLMHPRFIKGIAVRCGDQLVQATPSAYARGQVAVFLKLAEPLRHVTPLACDANAQPPYLAVTCQLANGEWITSIDTIGAPAAVTETQRRFRPVPSYCLIVDERGTPVGVSMSDELPVDDSWKGSPLAWPKVSAEELKGMLADTEKRADASLLRVALSFRSPKKSAGRMMMSRYRGDEEEATERNVVGVLVDDTTVLVLADLKAGVTARLERIVVHPKEGIPIPAAFVGTLSDYGALVAKLPQPLAGAVKLSGASAFALRNTLLLGADVKLQGERRVAYYSPARVQGFDLGWRRQVYPEVAGGDENLFLFTPEGQLAAFPVSRREKVSQEQWQSGGPALTAGTYLAAVLTKAQKQVDVSNVPLSEEEENRLAWIGVELQALDKELARVNNVSDLTRDGEIGALVSYVYENSPAAAAGVKAGDILLRLHVEGEPRPLEVKVEEYGFGRMGAFPWEQLDEVPEQYLNEIPTPWPPAENNLNRQLTEIGFGKKFSAEFFTQGELATKNFQVVQSPPHYNSAPKFKSEDLGLTVRDLTYEVQRYFQRRAEEGGVIVSKVEPGSKAAVSGIKPYEIVTHVNDKKVGGVADFQKLTAGQSELRLKIKRMTKGRVVKIKMTAATKPAATAQATTSEPAASEPTSAPAAESPTTAPAPPPGAPAEAW
ncbi:MAG: PDZ domain-containing protein [Phycisphaerae bacterium]|nr:PDZ domain-containing protein [Phycisphaerae bacterium]